MNNKNLTKYLIIILMFNIFFVACDNKEPSNGFNKRLRGKVNIVVPKERENYVKKFSQEFIKYFPNVTFNIRVEEDVYDNFDDFLNEKGKDKSNIIIMENKYAPYILKENQDELFNISSILTPYKDNYYKEDIRKLSVNNGIYGLPLDRKPYYMIYRKEIFEKSKINIEDIRTWQDFIDKCKLINKKNKNNYKFIWEESENEIYNVLLSQLAGRGYYLEESSNLSSSDILKVKNTIEIFKKEDVVTRENLIDEIRNGKLAATIVDINHINQIMKEVPEMSGKWVVSKVPSFEIGGNREISLDGYSAFVPKDTHNKELVLTFMEFMIANEKLQQELLLNQGIFPANINAYKWEELNKTVEYYNNIKLWLMAANTEKLLRVK
ncbi:ABC transporter substrate-binding protein [uncultured Clostridium sp.]|uniref:ABC transporter substrate-binding protein n=1 Tax=uncultured Clostridium sp. TaxID=59620 RepID=UPI0028E20F13|nr:ABC transporter substrate-binding protein [uncultured Clostridium sp.]